MCCFLATLFAFGPRLAVLVWWIINPSYIDRGIDSWIQGFLAWIFLPWTLLMYLFVYSGGIVGFDWILLGLGFLADLGSYSGGAYGNRRRFGY